MELSHESVHEYCLHSSDRTRLLCGNLCINISLSNFFSPSLECRETSVTVVMCCCCIRVVG